MHQLQTDQQVTPMEKKKKATIISKEEKEGKGKKKLKKENNNKPQISDHHRGELVRSGFIHVRARRGQATDNHSLAERARREKIRERLQLLQSLVPGCDKITGKAQILDEIIRYVQSLQNQVECLATKLASVNSMLMVGLEEDPLMTNPQEPDHQADQWIYCCPEPPFPTVLEEFTSFTDVATFIPPTSASLGIKDDEELFSGLEDQRQTIAIQFLDNNYV